MPAAGRWLPVMLLTLTLCLSGSLSGCGGPTGEGGGSGSGSSGSSASSGSPSQTEPVDIHVTIADGEVTPAGERVDVTIGQPIRLVVDSDAADELHVHSTPEQEFEIPAGAHGKVYQLTLDQPGVVEVELHELDEVVVSIAARP